MYIYVVIETVAFLWMRKNMCMSYFDIKFRVFIKNVEWHGYDLLGKPSHNLLASKSRGVQIIFSCSKIKPSCSKTSE